MGWGGLHGDETQIPEAASVKNAHIFPLYQVWVTYERDLEQLALSPTQEEF